MSNIPDTIWSGDAFIIEDGNLLRIVCDSEPDDPRNWDNMGTMVCWHRRHTLGDKHDYQDPNDFLLQLALGKEGYEIEAERQEAYNNDEKYEPDDFTNNQLVRLASENYAILPLYLFDHSRLHIGTAPFSCPWDSGQVGYIYVSKEKIFTQCMYITEDNWRERAETILKNEVKTYDDYLSGAVLGYEVWELKGNEATDLVDSCSGYYGNETKRNGLLGNFVIVRQVNIETKTRSHTTITIV